MLNLSIIPCIICLRDLGAVLPLFRRCFYNSCFYIAMFVQHHPSKEPFMVHCTSTLHMLHRWWYRPPAPPSSFNRLCGCGFWAEFVITCIRFREISFVYRFMYLISKLGYVSCPSCEDVLPYIAYGNSNKKIFFSCAKCWLWDGCGWWDHSVSCERTTKLFSALLGGAWDACTPLKVWQLLPVWIIAKCIQLPLFHESPEVPLLYSK